LLNVQGLNALGSSTVTARMTRFYASCQIAGLPFPVLLRTINEPKGVLVIL